MSPEVPNADQAARSGAPLAIRVAVGGDPWVVLAPPADFGARDWILGVVAVQAFFTPGDGLTARVRAHRTGDGEPRERALSPGDHVDIELRPADDASPARRSRVRSTVSTGPGSLTAYIGAATFGRADLPEGAGTPLRAFGHVFVRWTRSGPHETGLDLTGFAPCGSGEMFGRIRSERLEVGVPVTYQVDWGRLSP